ncbi:MAG TPA: hypothetical protein VL860_15590 [Planctomycetota bacterium]|nr:hypothetical protein [Planctomycetota bacterium]
MHSHRQLYDFAHRLLPQLLNSAPAQFFMILSGEKAPMFLGDIWDMVNEECRKASEPFDPAVEPWKTHTVKIGNFPAVIVEMPPPQDTTHAYAICAVLMLDIELEMPKPEALTMRYFTLERNDLSSTGTILCGWNFSKDSPSHANYGEGAKPGDILDFARGVKALLAPADSKSETD